MWPSTPLRLTIHSNCKPTYGRQATTVHCYCLQGLFSFFILAFRLPLPLLTALPPAGKLRLPTDY
ncbi:hypothetical protein, partial [Algoriphagus sp.]|uniref:hypothetical protein n=1 Tax=Algoriphagus sp. TaxID=1872435 RepID=UPI0025DDC478